MAARWKLTKRRTPPAGPGGLRAVVEGHGWYDLAPHRWARDELRLETALELPAAGGWRAFDVSLAESAAESASGSASGSATGSGGELRVHAVGPKGPGTEVALQAAVVRMLRAEEDLEAFWQATDAHELLHWVRSRGGGRLLRSASVFEDLLKILFTTNCSWALTRTMCARLVEHAGRPAPSGARAFPGPAACAELDEATWRGEIRVGYRAAHAHRISADFASGALAEAHFEDPELPTAELRARLLALPGFGPYAAGQALRLLGHYDDLALDSWCRARGAELAGRKKSPPDSWFTRRYRSFGRFAGLALWCELTGCSLGDELS